ncbi:hypothetical protein Tco_1363698 [Tanacetum coccineum]
MSLGSSGQVSQVSTSDACFDLFSEAYAIIGFMTVVLMKFAVSGPIPFASGGGRNMDFPSEVASISEGDFISAAFWAQAANECPEYHEIRSVSHAQSFFAEPVCPELVLHLVEAIDASGCEVVVPESCCSA